MCVCFKLVFIFVAVSIHILLYYFFFLVGLGNLDSDCGMVKFQGEIDRFRKMYSDTMKMVPER